MTTFNQHGQTIRGDQYYVNGSLIQTSGDVTRVEGDYVGGDKISIGTVSGTGIAIGHDAQAYGQDGGDAASVDCAFEQIYTAITMHQDDPHGEREDLIAVVRQIQQEAQKGDQASEARLLRWLGMLAGIAEDIFVVTVQVLASPQAGCAPVVGRVAARVAQERE